jgi:hypothetical protein
MDLTGKTLLQESNLFGMKQPSNREHEALLT